ncbi:MAG: PKD domain-containing protein [Bacteroidota bacterium]
MVSATHIVGGSLNYTHNGGDSYTVTLKLYRDCCPTCAAYPASVTITVLQADGTPFTPSRDFTMAGGVVTPVPLVLPPCATAPPSPPCVEERSYTATVNLPAAVGGMHLYYSVCCRNGSVVNIQNPGTIGETFYAFIPCYRSAWVENFTLPNGTTVDNGTTAWSRTVTGTPTLPTAQVNNDQFEVISQNSAAASTVVWSSQVINIASFTSGVNLSVNYSEPASNTLENSDSIKVLYSLNGGPLTLFPVNGSAFNDFNGSRFATASGLIGTTVQVFVRIAFGATSPNDELYRFDMVSVYNAAFAANSNPVYGNPPPLLFCSTNNFSINHSATDADGDSLVYSMYTPYTNAVPVIVNNVATFTPVTWVAGYSATSPFNSGGPGVTLNPSTGLLTGVANTLGQFVFGVKVQEFRAGTLLSEVVRDYQVTTVTCPPSIPPAPTAGSNSPVCVGQTLNLTASTVSGATYSWTGPNGFTSTQQNPSIPSVTLAAAGTYSVTATISGCTGPPGTTTVTVNPLPAAPTAGSNSPICAGQTLNLTASNIVGATYNWSGPNGFTSTQQNPSIPNATVAATGTYSVTATVNGCTGPAGTVTVTVTAAPAAPTAGSNSPVCVGQTLNLTASNIVGATYNWTGPNGFTSTLQNPSIAGVTLAAAGTYSVTATVGGCTGPAGTVTVTVNPNPVAPTAGSNSPVCVGQTLNLTASSIVGATYNWFGPNGFTSSLQNPSITNVTLAAAGTYTVTATVNGCTGPGGTVTVTVNPTPAAPTAGSNSPVCSGQTLNLTASNIVGATYNWSGPNGFTSTSQNPSIPSVTLAAAGTYTVTATVAGCTSPNATTTVVVNATPAAPTAGSNSPVCTGQTLNLTASTIVGAAYNWSGPNGFTSTSQNPSITNVTLAAAGTYSVTATVAGCTGPAGTVTVTVNATPAAPTAGSNTPVCTGQTLNLTASNIVGATYNWTGPNAFTSALQNPSIPSVTLAAAGTYTVTATVSGCTSPNATTTVVVNATPAAPTAGSNSPLCVGQTLNLTASTIVGASYNWSGPNGFTSTSQNPSITNVTLAAAGTYSVTATVNGCTSVPGTVTVVVNSTPATPTAGSNSPVCTGQTLNLTASTIVGATYNWSGPNGFTSTLQNPSIANVTLAAAGTYTVTAFNGCSSSPATTVVVVNATPATPTAGSNSPVCLNGTLNLTCNNVVGATYNWSGPNGFTSTSQNPSIPNVTLAAAGTYSVTVTVSGCTSLPGTVNVVVSSPAVVSAGPDQTVCGNNAATSLSGSSSTGSATWSTSGTGTFSPNNTTLNATYNPSAGDISAGTVTLTLTSSNNGGCAPVTDQMVITITPAPTVSAGPDQTVCANNANVTLNGTFTVSSGIVWTTSGTGTFSPGNTSPSATYIPSSGDTAAGTVTITITTTGNGNCLAVSDQMIITITNAPVVSAGIDDSVCVNNPNVTLNGSSSTGTFTWTTSGSGTFNPNNTTANATYIPSAGDLAAGSVTITITSGNNGNCLAVTDQMVITYTPQPVVNAGPDATMCANNDSIALNGTSTTGAGVWTTSGSGTFSPNNTTLNASYLPSNADTLAGTVTLTLTSANNGGCLAVTDQVVITITDAPTANAGPDASVCSNNAVVTLNGSFTVSTGAQWSTSGSGSFSPNTTTMNATYTPSSADTAAGMVTIYLTTTGNGQCNAVIDSMTITYTNAPQVSAGTNAFVCKSNPNYQLNGSSSTGSGTWTTLGSGTFTPNNNTSNATYVPSTADTTAGTVTLIFTSTNNGGCNPVSDTVVLTYTNTPTVNAGSNQTVCANNASVALNGSTSTGTGSWSTSGSGAFTPNNTTLNATYIPSPADTAAGTVTLTLTATNGCFPTAQSIVITITDAPFVNAGPDQAVCQTNPNATLNGYVGGGSTTGIWSSSGSGSFTPNNTTLNATYIPSNADTAAGSVILVLTSTSNGNCNAVTDTLVITYTQTPIAYAGPDLTGCANNPVQLNGVITGGNGTGIWTTPDGTGIFLPNNTTLNGTYTPSNNDTLQSPIIIILTSTNNGGCVAAVDTLLITVNPGPDVDAGPDQTVCSNNASVSLSGAVLVATGGIWSTSGTGTFAPSNTALNATYTPSSADISSGSVTLVLTSTGNGLCNAVTDTMVVTFSPSPLVNAGSTIYLCTGTMTANLNGSVTGGSTTGIWSTLGSGTFTPSNTTLNATYNLSTADTAAGSVTLILTSTNNGNCLAEDDTVTIIITSIPTTSAGIDDTVCANNAVVTLNGSVIGGSGSGQWTSSGTGTFAPSDTSLNATYTPSAGDIAAGTVTLYLTAINSCIPVMDSLVITITPAPTVNAGNSVTICASGIVNLSGSVTVASGGQWTSSGTGTFAPSNTALNAVYIPSSGDITAGSVIITLTSTGNGLCNAVSDSLLVTIESKPVADFGNTPACVGTAISFTDMSTVANGNIVTWNWDFGNGTSALQNPSNTYTATGLQTVTLIVGTVAGCADTITRTIYVNVVPTSTFTSQTFCPDSAMFTDGSSIASGSISTWNWSFGDSASSSLQNPTHTYDSTGSFIVTLVVTSDSGCFAAFSDTILLDSCSDVIPDLPVVPSAFTPNGDGVNDFLLVRGGPLSEMEFRIFNEWGNQIFLSTDQATGWDGTYKGKMQPGGTYIYTVVGKMPDGTDVKFSGDVTIIR